MQSRLAPNNMNANTHLLKPKDMLALIESGRELSAQMGLDVLLQSILVRASELTDSPDTSVILKHDVRKGLYVAAATGDRAEWVLTTFGKHSAKEIPLDASKAGEVFETGKSIIENKLRGHFKGVDSETKKVTESMVCVPLRVGDNALGVMQILNKRGGDYSERDLLVLEHFASQAAVAIKNAQLFESLLAHSGIYTRLNASSEFKGLMQELHRPAYREKMTVLFADMRGYTQLCQSLASPTELQDHLNEFISMLAEEIIVHDGMVNKFLGDGVMALFRVGDHAENSVRAAFQIIERFGPMAQRWNNDSSEQLDFLDIGIGIVTDMVTIGAIGTEKVRDFTAIGSAVNLAAALENQARDGSRIIVNQLTYRAVKEQVEAETLADFVLMKAGQSVGIPHKRYSLKKLVKAPDDQIFVCHSHVDRAFVESQLLPPLKQLGIKTWYASDDIRKGDLWTAEIRKALSLCRWMIVIVSGNSKGSDWVRFEVDMALALGAMRGNIIPVLLDDTDPKTVNEYLATMQAVDARSQPDMTKLMIELIQVGQGNRDASPPRS